MAPKLSDKELTTLFKTDLNAWKAERKKRDDDVRAKAMTLLKTKSLPDVLKQLKSENAAAVLLNTGAGQSSSSLILNNPASAAVSGHHHSDAPSIAIQPVVNHTQGSFDSSAKDMIANRKRKKSEATSAANDQGEEQSNVQQIKHKHVPVMRHRLRKNLEFFRSFVQSTLVLSWIATGFDLRWANNSIPPPMEMRNHQSAFDSSTFVI
jgi:hypothetical protein